MITVRRIVHGIHAHFPIRWPEWVMAAPALGMGIALLEQHAMFQASPSFTTLAAWADQTTWAFLVLFCCFVRVVALTVNGTFHGFGWSPHMRLGASLCGLFFWSQYTLGFFHSAFGEGGSWSAPVMYSTAVMFELGNSYRAWLDVLHPRRR